MEVVLRGVRGSIAVPAPAMSFYGGNTSCVELRTDNVLPTKSTHCVRQKYPVGAF